MRNFILFVVAVSILSVTGYVLYRVYYKGESADTVFQELRGNEEQPDVLADAREAYRQGDYAEALRGFELVREAHESGQSGGTLEEHDYKDLLIQIAACYKSLWEAGGKTDETLRIKALRTYEKYIDEFPDTSNRNIGRAMGELRNPATVPAAAEETLDESPPK